MQTMPRRFLSPGQTHIGLCVTMRFHPPDGKAAKKLSSKIRLRRQITGDKLIKKTWKEYGMKFKAIAACILLLCSFASAEVQRFNISVGDSPQKGPKDAPVTIIEFLDFQ
jgi:hypothetical protein